MSSGLGKASGLFQFLHNLCYTGVAGIGIGHAHGLLRIGFNAEDTAAAQDELPDFLHGFHRGSPHLHGEEHAVLLGAVAELPLFHGGPFQDAFGDIIGPAAVLVDGFPYQGGIGHVQLHGEGFRLHAHGGPEVCIGGEDGYIRVHIGVPHQRSHAGPVVVQKLEVRPPGVFLVVIASVAHPAREGSILGRVVESVPYRMGDAGDARHVGTHLQVFQRSGEHIVGIGHLLGTHQAFSLQMGGR